MTCIHWVKAAGNPAAEQWLTRSGCRTALVVVPHMTAGTRLADVLPLIEIDSRVQVLCCVPTTTDAWPGVEEYVRGLGGLVIPWHQVLRSRFDLALAASYSEIDKIPAPVMVVPRGVGGGRSRHSPWTTPQDGRQVQPRDVLVRDGRVVPAAVVVAHESDGERLRRECPEAAERIVVAGDPCYDRIRASMPFRSVYRKALGLGRQHKPLLLSSTWSRYSLFGGDLEVWGRVVPPEERWRAALVAADFVIGDLARGPAPGRGGARAPRRRRAAHGRRQPAVGPPDAEGHAELARTLTTAVASGEMLTSVGEHYELIRHRAVDILQPDAPEPWVEHFDWLYPLFNERLECGDGRMHLSGRPGLGITDRAAAAPTRGAAAARVVSRSGTPG